MSNRQNAPFALPVDNEGSKSELSRADLFASVAPNHPGDNVDLMIGESLIPGLTFPAVQIAAAQKPVYIAELPEMRSKFVRSLLHRAVYRGEIHTADEWCVILAGDGAGYQVKGSDQIRPISEETFRADFNLLAALTKMPLGSKASDGEKVGFGMARSREQIKDSERDLLHRADKMYERYQAGEAVEAADDGWFDGQPVIPESDRWNGELVELIVRELTASNYTNGEVALMLASGQTIRALREQAKGQEDDEQLLTPDQRDRYLALCDGPVRQFINWLALNGVPVCAGNRGYWIARDRKELRDYLGRPHRFQAEAETITIHTGLLGRIEATREHAELLPDVAALWYPQTQADQVRRDEILAIGPQVFILPVEMQERDRLRKRANQERTQAKTVEAAADWVAAATAYKEKYADEYLAIKQLSETAAIARGSTAGPTKRQLVVKARYLTARKVCQMPSPRRQRMNPIKPGQVPMPWEYDPVEKTGAPKTTGIKTASASDLHKRAKKKTDDVEPCPW